METVNRLRSSVSVEDWIVDSRNAIEVQRKSSMIQQIIHRDDVLVVVCVECMVARLAVGMKTNANKFTRELAVSGGSSMTGLGLMSYCTVINGRCMGEDASLNPDPSMTIKQLMH